MIDNLKSLLSSAGYRLRVWFQFRDVMFLVATAAVGYGIWQIHQPSAFIVIGAFFVVLTTYGRFKQ